MDAHTLDCLDFPRVREILGGYAACGLGRSLAATIRPVSRPDLVRRWHAQVVELQRLAEQRGLPPLGGLRDVRESVRRCAPPLRVTVDEVAAIGETLAATHAIAGYFADLPADCPELRHLAERLGDFRSIAERIARVIDPRGAVRDDASPKLAALRGQIAECRAQIEHVVQRLLADGNVRRYLQFANHTFHNDRLVLPLKMEYRGRIAGIVHRSSDSGATIYVEPAAAVELNNRITGLRADEAEEIARLLWELAHEIHINAEAILKTIDTLAVIDLTVAKVRWARDYAMRCPEVVNEPTLRVREARHPLLIDLSRRNGAGGEGDGAVVPIAYRLGDDFDMLIITGPNTGGKTVTLKTVGLLSLMVQAGLPVPVGEGSAFGLFQHVFIDIGDEQSMAQSLSTFSAHMTRQMEFLKRAGPHTLVLLDELGAGTDPDEGAAIGVALLDEYRRLGTRCIATTHIGALKSYPLQRPRVENGCVEFDVESLRPTYRLVLGEPGMSHAIAIAQRLGMPKRIIHAARGNLSKDARRLHAAIQGTVDAKRQAEKAREAADTARLNAEKRQDEAAAARAALERQQQAFEQWVQRVVHLSPGDAVRVRGFDRDGRIVRLRLDLHRAEVDVGSFAVEVPLGDVLPPETPAPPPRPPRPAVAPVARPRPARPAPARPSPGNGGHPSRPGGRPGGDGAPRPTLPSLTPEQVLALSPGDRVIVKRFHREGTLVRINAEKKLAVVNVGLLEVEAPFDGLAQKPPRTQAPTSARAAMVSPEPLTSPNQGPRPSELSQPPEPQQGGA